MIGFGPDHHFGRVKRVVPPPQLPNDSSVVIIVNRVSVVFSVQIGLETAENKQIGTVQHLYFMRL